MSGVNRRVCNPAPRDLHSRLTVLCRLRCVQGQESEVRSGQYGRSEAILQALHCFGHPLHLRLSAQETRRKSIFPSRNTMLNICWLAPKSVCSSLLRCNNCLLTFLIQKLLEAFARGGGGSGQ